MMLASSKIALNPAKMLEAAANFIVLLFIPKDMAPLSA